jgi:hypothetical protein
MALLNQQRFWEQEFDAPLLLKNRNFVTELSGPEMLKRAHHWLPLVGANGDKGMHELNRNFSCMTFVRISHSP